MTTILNFTQDDLDAILTILEPVVLEGYGVYFKPKYEALTEETWEKGVNALQKELPIVPVTAQEGTVYVASEKTPANDIKALQIATELLKHQMSFLKERGNLGTPAEQQAVDNVPQIHEDSTSGQSQEDVIAQIYGSPENKTGWLNALRLSFQAIPLQSDEGFRVMALRPYEQNIKSMTYMKAVSELARLVPCRPAVVDGQRFLLSKTPADEQRFSQIASDLYQFQQNAVVHIHSTQNSASTSSTRVVLKGGNILNPGSVFKGTPAPLLKRKHIR